MKMVFLYVFYSFSPIIGVILAYFVSKMYKNYKRMQSLRKIKTINIYRGD
jgi:uncharacterized membrane protein